MTTFLIVDISTSAQLWFCD